MREIFMETCGITHVSGRILGQTREQCLENMNQMNTLFTFLERASLAGSPEEVYIVKQKHSMFKR